MAFPLYFLSIDEKGRKHRAIRGRDVVIPVPVGTTLSTDDGRIIGELEEEGSKIVVAKGGRGGSAATVNWCGEKGERDIVRLEMRLHSDIALVGYVIMFQFRSILTSCQPFNQSVIIPADQLVSRSVRRSVG